MLRKRVFGMLQMLARLRFGFTQTGHWVPFLAGAGTLVSLAVTSTPDTLQGREAAVGLGIGLALAAAIVGAFAAAWRDTASRAHGRTYASLVEHLEELETQLACLSKAEVNKCLGLQIAEERVAHVKRLLSPDAPAKGFGSHADQSWTTGEAYQDVWSSIHRAEEALIAYDT